MDGVKAGEISAWWRDKDRQLGGAERGLRRTLHRLGLRLVNRIARLPSLLAKHAVGYAAVPQVGSRPVALSRRRRYRNPRLHRLAA